MKKTFFKTVTRSVRGNTARLLSVAFIILLGIAFVSGLGTLSPTILRSFSEELRAANVSDAIAVSESGFSEEEIEALADVAFVTAAEGAALLETGGEENVRLYLLGDTPRQVNTLTLAEGEYPDEEGEVLLDRACAGGYAVGDTAELTLFGMSVTLTVTGIAESPLLFSQEGEPGADGQPLSLVAYLPASSLGAFASFVPVTQVYLTFEGSARYEYLSEEYDAFIEERVSQLEEQFPAYTFLTSEENASCVTLESYCDKVSVITLIFPVFFIAVTALVVLTTMTRMVEDERAVIGCYRTLGLGGRTIAGKYLLIALGCALLACAVGMAVGLTLLPVVIYPAFAAILILPAMSAFVQPVPGLISVAAMLAVTLAVSWYVVRRSLGAQPAELLRPRAPKAGKMIFLEHIPFLWKRLAFRYKSSLRNVFRYKGHLLMTVISVAGSTALVFAGFSLRNIADRLAATSGAAIADTLIPISLLVIVFALLLCAFVVYNLTNMDISERVREIATLRVLGYRGREAAEYIYREVLIMAVMGICIGIPLGVGLVQFVVAYLEFGALSDVAWYSYLLSAALVLVFVAAVDLLLLPKILRVNMTEALKSVE